MTLRKLLINADDLGYDTDTLTVTRDLMERGSIRSATILLGFPASDDALRFASGYSREFSFGLHFNIAEGRPLARETASLTGPDGQFRAPVQQRLRALSRQLRSDEIARELEAQLSVLADNGITPSHVDSHGHLHKFPHVIGAMSGVLQRFGIRKVRRPQTDYDAGGLPGRILNAICARSFQRYGFASTDRFFNTARHDNGWFTRFISSLPDGMTELGVHPGGKEDWRAIEAAPLYDPHSLLERHGTQIVSYHDVAESH